MRFLRASPLVFLLVTGCVTTRKEERKTGLFGNDPKALMAAFKKIGNNKTTKNDLRALGFDVFDKEVDNVEIAVGVPAFRELYGQGVFERTDPTKLINREFLSEINRYTLVKIPYYEVVTEEDRFYFSTKETFTTGDDIRLAMVLFDDLVIYNAPTKIKINQRTTESAFAEGFLKIIDKYGKFGSDIKDLVEKLQDFLKKKDDN